MVNKYRKSEWSRISASIKGAVKSAAERAITQSGVYAKHKPKPKSRVQRILNRKKELEEFARYEKRIKFRGKALAFLEYRASLNNLELQESLKKK